MWDYIRNEERHLVRANQKITDAWGVIYRDAPTDAWGQTHYLMDYDFYIGNEQEAIRFRDLMRKTNVDSFYDVMKFESVDIENVTHSPSFNHLFVEQYTFEEVVDRDRFTQEELVELGFA